MAKKVSKKSSGSVKQNTMIGVSSKGNRAPTPTPPPEKEKLTKKQVIILVCVMLIAVIISGSIIGTVIAVKRINNPDFMKSNLSRYISISADDYTGYEINIPLDEFGDEMLERKINMLLTEHKTSAEARYDNGVPLTLGDTVAIYFRGYTVGEDGRETDFEGSSNIADETTTLEVGTGNVIDDETGKVSGNFIPGFGEALLGIIPNRYSELEKLTEGRVMAGDVIYLSYTVIGGKDGVNKTVKSERIDLALPYIDEIYGEGFTEFFTGKAQDGEAEDFKNIGEDIKKFICRIGDSKTETIYSDMKVEFATRDSENNPIILKVRFPANYGEESLRGKEAYFDVYINSASSYDAPVFDEKFITEKLKVTAEDLSSYKGESLVDKYREKLTEELKKEVEDSNRELLVEAMWDRLLDKVEIKKLPKKMVENYYDSYYSTIAKYYYNVYANSYSSIDKFAVAYLNAYYDAGLKDGDDWKGYIRSIAEEDVTRNLLFYYIIRKENLFPSEEKYRETYDAIFNGLLSDYINLHKSEFEGLEGEKYNKKLEEAKSEIKENYSEEYFEDQVYWYYGSRELLKKAKIVK